MLICAHNLEKKEKYLPKRGNFESVENMKGRLSPLPGGNGPRDQGKKISPTPNQPTFTVEKATECQNERPASAEQDLRLCGPLNGPLGE